MNEIELPISEERYQELKAVVVKHRAVVTEWAEALREIKASGRWKKEANSWEQWCRDNAGVTAAALRMQDYRARKQIEDAKTPEPPERNSYLVPVMPVIEKAKQVLSKAVAKRDLTAPPPTMHTPQVVDAKPVAADVRILIHKVAVELERLLQDSSFAMSEKFRHCVIEMRHVDQMLQPDLPGLEVPAKQKSRGTWAEVLEFFRSISLTGIDADWFYNKCEGCGWKNNGKAIVDWRATVRAWEKLKIFPSQKQTAGSNGKLSSAEMMVRQKELESAQAQMTSIRNSYSEHQTWSDRDKERWQKLKTRRDELRGILGIKV